MHKYETITLENLDEEKIDTLYIELLTKKLSFIIINFDLKHAVLTKEKSLFEIDDIDEFITAFNKDIYYTTKIINDNVNISANDFALYKSYIKKYINHLSRNKYGNKFLFGSVAIRTSNGIITTIRGKENFDDYTLIKNVDHNNHVVIVHNVKATLNAPLLDYLFKNLKVKAIVHINHEFDDSLPYYDYAFPGTVKDSMRNNATSFNIKYHGLFYLFDEKGKLL